MEKAIDDNDDSTNDNVKSESPEIERYTSGDERGKQDSGLKMKHTVKIKELIIKVFEMQMVQ